MAQVGFTPIQLYFSSTTTNVPLAANLANGELAINITDGKLFYKDNANAVQVIAWKVTPTTAGGTGLTTYTAGDMVYYASGTVLSKLGIGANNYVLTSNGSAPVWTANTGTGDVVRASSPTLTTPNLGTPSTLVLTNATGLPQTGFGTNVAGNGPSFSAYRSGTQNINDNTLTKVQYNDEEWDTNNNYDPTTNFRFTPTVAGYYQVSAGVYFQGGIIGEATLLFYKNGAAYKNANDFTATTTYILSGSCLIYCNGSTDYIEIYAYQNSGVAKNIANSSIGNFFQAALVRAA